jgi:hypothetical protein
MLTTSNGGTWYIPKPKDKMARNTSKIKRIIATGSPRKALSKFTSFETLFLGVSMVFIFAFMLPPHVKANFFGYLTLKKEKGIWRLDVSSA